MASYSPATLDEIRAGVDVVDLVGRFVNLRKAGQNYKGLCPFHSEKTPSFVVYPNDGSYHCFGCGASGDAFSFLMKPTSGPGPSTLADLFASAYLSRHRRGL